MDVMVVCRDRDDGTAAQLRAAHLDAHLSYIETILDRIRVAGPAYDADGQAVVGSLLVFAVASVEEARALVAGDPYHRAGVWADIDIRPFKGVAGAWVGGKSW